MSSFAPAIVMLGLSVAGKGPEPIKPLPPKPALTQGRVVGTAGAALTTIGGVLFYSGIGTLYLPGDRILTLEPGYQTTSLRTGSRMIGVGAITLGAGSLALTWGANRHRMGKDRARLENGWTERVGGAWGIGAWFVWGISTVLYLPSPFLAGIGYTASAGMASVQWILNGNARVEPLAVLPHIGRDYTGLVVTGRF